MSQRLRLLDFMAIRLALFMIKPESTEEAVQRLWQSIVGAWFPVAEGYHCAVKAQMLTNNDMPSVVVLQILALQPDPEDADEITERCILQVECMRPSLDTPSSWENTTKGQFLDDLEVTSNASNRLCRAVAIGKKVQFYRYDGTEIDTSRKLVPLHNSLLDLDTASGQMQAEPMMDHVKANGWRWATSS